MVLSHRRQARSNNYPKSEKMRYSIRDGAFFMTASVS